MSKERALRAMNLEPTDRVPCMEWVDHPAFVEKVTGIDPFEYPVEAVLKMFEVLDIDWYIGIPEKARKFSDGETSRVEDGIRYTEWGFVGSPWENENVFCDEEDVLSYDPFDDPEGRVRISTPSYRQKSIGDFLKGRKLAGNLTLVSGLYYTTLFQCFIMAFGWEMFLVTARLEPERFKRTIKLFTEFSIRNVREWLSHDPDVMFCHDDLSISRGLVFPKEWYIENIFPNYERIFEPIKKAGKKLIFVSDGNYSELIDELFAVGVDGIIVDNYVDIDPVIERYGHEKVICGNVDSRILTMGNTDDVRNEVKRCMDTGRRYPGYFIRAAGDLPHNIPLQNIECYFDACRELGARR